MDEGKNVIWSLVPLILIILFSWLFGVLGNKMKKPQQETDVDSKGAPADRPFDIFSALKEAAGQISRPEAGADVDDRRQVLTGTQGWRPDVRSGGPTVTAKPITPKWWGA